MSATCFSPSPAHRQKTSIMPQIHLAERNVFVYDASVDPPLVVAGCHQFGTTTHAELYHCLGICFQEPRSGEFRLYDGQSQILLNDGTILAIGNYFVIALGSITISQR
jgi:hypothetical protein